MEININALHTNEDWLRFFARLGMEAQKSLSSATVIPAPVKWSEISSRFFTEAYPPVPSGSRPDYTRWIDCLLDWASRHGITAPDMLGRQHAAALAKALIRRGTAPARRFRFYRRIWRTFGLDATIWNVRESLEQPNADEHYRRLTTAEIRKLIDVAGRRSHDLADMISIGYWTGLRLSDVAELERGEVALEQLALHIVPNKVKTRKKRPLTIPLVGDAANIVRRRMMQSAGKMLFSPACRMRPSRKIGKIFKLAHVEKIGSGRASFHSLRATFISLMDEAGVQPYITDAITGHASGSMHARYTQPAASILRRAIVKAIPAIPAPPR